MLGGRIHSHWVAPKISKINLTFLNRSLYCVRRGVEWMEAVNDMLHFVHMEHLSRVRVVKLEKTEIMITLAVRIETSFRILSFGVLQHSIFCKAGFSPFCRPGHWELERFRTYLVPRVHDSRSRSRIQVWSLAVPRHRASGNKVRHFFLNFFSIFTSNDLLY